MKYKIVTSGKSKEVPLNELSRNLKVQSEIYALSDKEVYLGLISRQTLVFFATEFANYALQNYTKKIIPEAQTCIDLTRKWLEDQSSVSTEQLRVAASAVPAAANAADAAHYAANTAYYAANPANAASAANVAANFAYAANAAAGVGRDKECLRQGEFIIDFLKSGRNLFLV